MHLVGLVKDNKLIKIHGVSNFKITTYYCFFVGLNEPESTSFFLSPPFTTASGRSIIRSIDRCVCAMKIYSGKGKVVPVHVMKAYSGRIGKAPLILNHCRWRWMVKFTPRPLYPRERTKIPIELVAGWAPEPIWSFSTEKNLSPCRNSNPGSSSP